MSPPHSLFTNSNTSYKNYLKNIGIEIFTQLYDSCCNYICGHARWLVYFINLNPFITLRFTKFASATPIKITNQSYKSSRRKFQVIIFYVWRKYRWLSVNLDWLTCDVTFSSTKKIKNQVVSLFLKHG